VWEYMKKGILEEMYANNDGRTMGLLVKLPYPLLSKDVLNPIPSYPVVTFGRTRIRKEHESR